jgi:glycine betaine/proline transport system substrate-binding protein
MSKIIAIGVTDLSFHRVTAALVANVLEGMGFEVARIYSPHEDNFKKLKAGEVDLLTSAWLPSSHGVYKAEPDQVCPVVESPRCMAAFSNGGAISVVTITISTIAEKRKSSITPSVLPIAANIRPTSPRGNMPNPTARRFTDFPAK